jgi:thioredoxin-dependent peroxiredoxin
MAQTRLGDIVVNTNGNLPQVGSQAPEFILTGNDLKDVTLSSFRGKSVILNIFPSIDTSTCAASVREFNKLAVTLPDTVVLCIARDLPYAMRRFCGAEGITNVITLSDFRSDAFSKDYGVMMLEGRMRGLFARVIIVVDRDGKISYEELVPTIGQEPNYDAALKAIGFGG